ncbi:MAG TPA: hypothetical protein VM243_15255, partial [Phycisphaerae bacterium]|nr:hypothetical protein [Phycisphaerae bacterium]
MTPARFWAIPIGILAVSGLLMATFPSSATAAVESQKHTAIYDGLEWLAQHQYGDGHWENNYSDVAGTGAALRAFLTAGYTAGSDVVINGTNYFDVIGDGLNYLFSTTQRVGIGVQPAGDPDVNGNGFGIKFGVSTYHIYDTSLAALAIVATGTPGEMVTTGSEAGRTYADVLQDVVDYLAYGQNDSSSSRGGWRFQANTPPSGNENSPWACQAMMAVEQEWGLIVPQFVKDELVYWIAYIQYLQPGHPLDGSSGFTAPTELNNEAKTGGLLTEMMFAGYGLGDGNVQAALGYLDRQWPTDAYSTWYGNCGNSYGMLQIYAGLGRTVGLDDTVYITNLRGSGTLDPGDTPNWLEDYCEYLVTRQLGDGSWAAYTYYDNVLATSWHVEILNAAWECLGDEDCDDDLWCNGQEVCVDQACSSGVEPCVDQAHCDEVNDVCLECIADGECDDALFCNGQERCLGNACTGGVEPCVDLAHCDEGDDVCLPWAGAVCVPALSTDPGAFHVTYSGTQITLKGIARAGATEYRWDFDDGDSTTWTTITDAYNLGAAHTYTGALGQEFQATLYVRSVGGQEAQDTYPVKVYESSDPGNPAHLDVRAVMAVDEGLWWLHTNMIRATYGPGAPGYDQPYGYWNEPNYGRPVVATGVALHAFGAHGTTAEGDLDNDPYVETMQRALNYLLCNTTAYAISVQSAGNPDVNGNGIGLVTNQPGATSHETYIGSMCLAGLASCGTPGRIAAVGVANVLGRTYADIVQDMVDFFAWGQADTAMGPYRGGWRYSANYPTSDMSCTPWPPLGMVAAEENMGAIVPQFVRDELTYFLNYAQYTTCDNNHGGFGYTAPSSMRNNDKTAGGIICHAFMGTPMTDPAVESAIGYLYRHWNDTGTAYENTKLHGNSYGMYSVAMAMRLPEPDLTRITEYDCVSQTGNSFDWYYTPSGQANQGLADYIIGNQQADGGWDDSAGPFPVRDGFCTGWRVLILLGGRPVCLEDGDCDDGLYCTGVESCGSNGMCQPGVDPCPGQLCRESDDQCVDCLGDEDCSDDLFCTGAETCDTNGVCHAGVDPCPGQLCRESDDQCVDCLGDEDCIDVLFCNGAEACDTDGLCQPGADPCPGQFCIEEEDVCVDCLGDADCNNDLYCSGVETCDTDGLCQPGDDPCPGQLCRESDDTCVDRVYVDDDAPGGDGLSWDTAFNGLQEALTLAAGSEGAVTEIRVARGTYQPAGPGGDRAATFQLISGVAIR